MKKIIYFTLSFLLTNMVVFGQIENGRVAYYPLNGTAIDQSANSLDGTLYGAIPSNDRLNNLSSAISFDGLDDFVELPNSNLLKPQFPFTISFWAKINESEATNFFVSDYVDQAYYGFWVGVTANNEVHVNFGDGGVSGGSSRQSKIAGQTMSIGVWYHITCIVRGINDMDIYMDCQNAGGTYSGSGDSQIVYSPTASPRLFNAVAQTTLPTTFMNGSMDELMIWNRELSISEITTLCSLNSIDEQLTSEFDDVRVFPNPSTNYLTIQAGSNTVTKVHVFDNLGKLVMVYSNLEGSIDVQHLKAGVYTLDIQLENGRSQKVNFVKL